MYWNTAITTDCGCVPAWTHYGSRC